MPATILLPPSTTVYVTATSSAANRRGLTITLPQGGAPTTFQGSGEGDHIIGQTVIVTPAGTQNRSHSCRRRSILWC